MIPNDSTLVVGMSRLSEALLPRGPSYEHKTQTVEAFQKKKTELYSNVQHNFLTDETELGGEG